MEHFGSARFESNSITIVILGQNWICFIHLLIILENPLYSSIKGQNCTGISEEYSKRLPAQYHYFLGNVHRCNWTETLQNKQSLIWVDGNIKTWIVLHSCISHLALLYTSKLNTRLLSLCKRSWRPIVVFFSNKKVWEWVWLWGGFILYSKRRLTWRDAWWLLSQSLANKLHVPFSPFKQIMLSNG